MKRTKTYFTILLALASFALAGAQDGEPKAMVWPAEPWKGKTPVEIGRELPRTRTICYDSEQAAIAGGRGESAYLQPLGQWERTASADGASVRYKHSFKFPFAWADRQLLLFIGSANAPYEVFVNGDPMGYNQSPQTPGEFNLTDFSREGVNSVEIVLHGDAEALVLENPAQPFSPTLTGDTYIVAQPRIRVRDFLTRTTIAGYNEAMVEIGVILKSHLLNPKTLTVHFTLLDPEGREVVSGRNDREIEMRQEDTVWFAVNVPGAKLWSPETPYLYTLAVKTQNEGRYWEYVAYKVGLRTVGAGNGKLTVNDREFPMYLAEYQTISREETLQAIPGLKRQGINLITVDAPQPDWFYDICDSAGLFVFTQAALDTRRSGESRKIGGNPANDPAWEVSYIDRTQAAYYTAANHPSVIGFSLASNPANGYNLYESYVNLKKILAGRSDGRPVIFEKSGGEWNTDAIDSATAEAKPQAIADRFIIGSDVAPAAYHPVTITMDDARGGQFTMHNNHFFATVGPVLNYTVKQGSSKVSSGSIPVSVAPQWKQTVNIPYGKAKAGGKPLTVTLSVRLPASTQEVSETFPFDF